METQFPRDDALIDRFLAGRLSEQDEAEFLSEYLGDHGRMQRLRTYLREREIPERFLRDELADAERDAFEKLGIADPDLFDELQLIERTRQGLREIDEAGELERRVQSSRWPSLLQSPRYAAAASVLLAASVVLSGVLWRDNVNLRENTGLATEFTTTRSIPVFSTRGAATEIDAPEPTALTVLFIDPGRLDFDSYRATVQRVAEGARQVVWQQDELEPIYDQIAIGLPGGVLQSGDYEVLVEGRVQDAPNEPRFELTNTVLFEVVPAGR